MIYQDCWNEVSASNCVYSGHAFGGGELRVFVECGLDIWSERLQKHVQPDGSLGIGKCVLIFGGVSRYQWCETPFEKSASGQVIWGQPETEQFSGDTLGMGEQYFLDGTVLDASKAVWAEICARSFALDVQE